VNVEIETSCRDGSKCPTIRGVGLIDTGADQTAIDVARLDAAAMPSSKQLVYGAVGGGEMQPVFPARVRFPGGGAGPVDLKVVASPALHRQRLDLLLGRDALHGRQFRYDGARGAFLLAAPDGVAHDGPPAEKSPLPVAAGLAALALVAAAAALYAVAYPPPVSVPAGVSGAAS
jgi:hypothetical protein